MGKHRTLITPAPQALRELWRKETVKQANNVDRLIVPGNIISLLPQFADKEKKGDNNTILRYVLTYSSTDPETTVLIGPNEIAALSLPTEWTNSRSLYYLRNYWLTEHENSILVATVLNNRLVTHGGLTHGKWIKMGKPETPEIAADMLNAEYAGKMYMGPSLGLGYPPNLAADPIFADPFMEFYPSWITTTDEMPFGQILGSRSLNSREGREYTGDEKSPLYYMKKVSLRKSCSIALLNGKEVTSVGLSPKGKQITKLPKHESYYIEETTT